MPTLWYVKEVPYDKSKDVSYGNSCEEGSQVSFDELRGAFGEYKPKLLPKNWRFIGEPSGYPQCVVIVEVKKDDGTDGGFSQSGFYLLQGLWREQAYHLLGEYRGELPGKRERARGESLSDVKARVLEGRRLRKSPKREDRT